MSQHPSLRFDSVSVKHRNVLKRFERIKIMKEQGKWEGRQSVYGLPKIKSLKIKVKKTHEAPEEGTAQGAGAEAAAKASGGSKK